MVEESSRHWLSTPKCSFPKQVDHFLDFISSSHVIQDLPFGQKSIRLSTNEVVTVPNFVCMMTPESIVKQFFVSAEESNFDPLSHCTLLNIPSVCSRLFGSHCRGLIMSVQMGHKPLMTSVMLHSVEVMTSWGCHGLESRRNTSKTPNDT